MGSLLPDTDDEPTGQSQVASAPRPGRPKPTTQADLPTIYVSSPSVGDLRRPPLEDFQIPAPSPVLNPPPVPVAVMEGPRAQQRRGSKLVLWVFCSIGALAALGGIGLLYQLLWQRYLASSNVEVQISTTPPGASIRINGEIRCASDCKLFLPPAKYDFSASLDAFLPISERMTVVAGQPVSLSLKFVPGKPAESDGRAP